MNVAPSENSLPAWQIERQNILHRACLAIQRGIAAGQPVSRSIRRVARRNDGRFYKSAPRKVLKVTYGSMRRWWDTWRTGGETPLALRLNYVAPRAVIPRAVMVRFVTFCAADRHHSMDAAWRKFTALPANRSARTISPYLLHRAFPTARFYEMQDILKGVRAGQAALAELERQAIAAMAKLK